MPNVSQLGAYGDTSGSSLMFRNKLINGGFDIWQRGTSQTSSGYGSDDRWSNENTGSTKTASRQTFTLGQTDVPGSPKFWSRTVVSSVAGASNSCLKIQRVESVLTLAGQTATLSFWAKADASKNIAVEFVQWFGSGGGASSAVNGIGGLIALTTSWQRFTLTANVPSISGKVIGTSGDDHLALIFWFDAGSSLNARTNSLGQQSGTFDIANVQLEAGPQASPFEQRPIGTELDLCRRYCQAFNSLLATMSGLGSTTTRVTEVRFSPNLRATPANADIVINTLNEYTAITNKNRLSSNSATSIIMEGTVGVNSNYGEMKNVTISAEL